VSVFARGLDLAMAGLFAWAALLQLNDPDPVAWFAIYAAGGIVATLSGLRGRIELRGWLVGGAVLVAGVCLVWAGALATALLRVDLPELGDLAAPMTPDRPEVEWARELLGLLIVATWMASVAWRARRLRDPCDGHASG
jgi:hypothetical protein